MNGLVRTCMNTRGVVMGFLRSGSIPQRSVAYRANDRLRLAGRLEYCPGRHPWRVTKIHIYCQVALLGRATVRLFRGRSWILGVCLVGRCRPSSITTGAGGGEEVSARPILLERGPAVGWDQEYTGNHEM